MSETAFSLDKRHVIHSWSVNADLNPKVVDRAAGLYFWD